MPANVPAGWSICGPDPVNAGNVIVRLYNFQMDVMFSPRGNVTGTVAALGAMYFYGDMRDLRTHRGLDPTNLSLQPQGDANILAVFPQTGLVQTYDLDMTDNNSDGYADNIFNFAQRGQSASR